MPPKSEVLGAAEMQRVLRKLPLQLQNNIMRSVSSAGAKELQRVAYAHLALAMSSRSPREEDVIIRHRRNRTSRMQSTHDVGPPAKRPQLRWLHDGTEPHIISAVTKYGTRRGRRDVAYGARAGSILTNLAEIFGVDIDHPGQPARPWLKTAVFFSQDAVMRRMAQQMRRAMPRQVRKLVSSTYRNQQLRKLIR